MEKGRKSKIKISHETFIKLYCSSIKSSKNTSNMVILVNICWSILNLQLHKMFLTDTQRSIAG